LFSRNILQACITVWRALPAVPFEEDDKDPTIWFLDHSYLENMFRMFKKVNGEQRLGDTAGVHMPLWNGFGSSRLAWH
jgi:hypothetical protein